MNITGVQLMIRKTARSAAPIIRATTIPALSAAAAGETEAKPADPVVALVGRLDLEKYKATIKGLTRFGDRRQGTDRNRAAIDWIEAQLKSYGCTNTARVAYDYGTEPEHRGAPAAVNAADVPHFNVGRRRAPG